MIAPKILFLTGREISSLLSLKDCIEALEDGFRVYAEEDAIKPKLMHVAANEGELHIKAGGLKLNKMYLGLKANTGFFGNFERWGLPNIQGVIMLFDGDLGCPLACMDSKEITILRTGGLVAIAAKHLARVNSSVATICGCGNQGQVQLRALMQVLPSLQLVFAFDAYPKSAEIFADKLSEELGIKIEPHSRLEDAATQSEIVITCTPSKQYYLLKRFVSQGTFVAAVGADSPDKQELEPSLLVGNKVVVDILEQCAAAGELHHALELGLMRETDVYAEISDIIAGKDDLALGPKTHAFDV